MDVEALLEPVLLHVDAEWDPDKPVVNGPTLASLSPVEASALAGTRCRSEVFYQALFASSPLAIALTDPTTGCFRDVNTAFAQLVGRTRDELAGQHHTIVRDRDAARTSEGFAPGFAGGTTNPRPPLMDEVVRPDGTRREVVIRTRLLAEVSPPTMLSFFDDVTENNRLAREQARLTMALFESQKLEALGALAGAIAHDFNNLLSGICGHTELAQQDLDSPDAVREDLECALRATERAKDLVRQILAFSRRKPHKPQPLDVARVISEVLTLIRGSIPSTIECVVDVGENPGQILGQGTQLHQVTMNLCTNALYAMAETGGILKVSLRSVRLERGEELPPGTYVQLQTSDTGVGLSETVRPYVFEPYFTTRSTDQGTGLGLSVTLGIVQSMGGAIRVESVPGEGTTFTVLLPALPT